MALFGLFGKKKKKEELAPPEMGLGREYELGLKLPEEEMVGAGIAPKAMAVPAGEPAAPAAAPMGAPPGFAPQPMPMAAPPPISKDIELLSAKLDALKALLENINQRLQNLERIARGEHHERYY